MKRKNKAKKYQRIKLGVDCKQEHINPSDWHIIWQKNTRTTDYYGIFPPLDKICKTEIFVSRLYEIQNILKNWKTFLVVVWNTQHIGKTPKTFPRICKKYTTVWIVEKFVSHLCKTFNIWKSRNMCLVVVWNIYHMKNLKILSSIGTKYTTYAKTEKIQAAV